MGSPGQLLEEIDMKKEVRIYNVLLPIWMLIFFPTTWIVVLPGNFVIDLLVLGIALREMHVDNLKECLKKSILKVWLLGFAADFIGAAPMFIPVFADWEIGSDLGINPFGSIGAFLWTTACIIIAAVCIYWFNKKIAMKKCDITDIQRRKASLAMAIATAPYLFYFPSQLLYQ